jgi:hypothetical protein
MFQSPVRTILDDTSPVSRHAAPIVCIIGVGSTTQLIFPTFTCQVSLQDLKVLEYDKAAASCSPVKENIDGDVG